MRAHAVVCSVKLRVNSMVGGTERLAQRSASTCLNMACKSTSIEEVEHACVQWVVVMTAQHCTEHGLYHNKVTVLSPGQLIMTHHDTSSLLDSSPVVVWSIDR